MSLSTRKAYFLKDVDAILRVSPNTKSGNPNHLIMGDYVRFLGETQGNWAKVRSRGNTGWLPIKSLTEERMLEVNFIDIGQGDGCHIVTPDDKMILVDAGEGKGFAGNGGDNFHRFINWRYNLRNRRVKGVDGVSRNDETASDPVTIDYVIMSHPDLDHYYGFKTLFENKKVKVKYVGHNGIVERPTTNKGREKWFSDLGKSTRVNGTTYLVDTVQTAKRMKELFKEFPKTTKMYLSTLKEALRNNRSVKFDFISSEDGFFQEFDSSDLSIQVLAPVTETIEVDGKSKKVLRKLGNEGETKNGHSVVLMLQHGHVKMLLGGDLNEKSQDYLGQVYTSSEKKLSELEKDLSKYRELSRRNPTDDDLGIKYEEAQLKLWDTIDELSETFRVDFAKACHHGSSHVLNSFLAAINPLATIISSGDNESHAHPRPDALGVYGKFGRGDRPLILSTELGRNTNEFTDPETALNRMGRALESLKAIYLGKKEQLSRKETFEIFRDCNVARYGMITIRSDGNRVLVAQKLEKNREIKNVTTKWDYYLFTWDEDLQEFALETH